MLMQALIERPRRGAARKSEDCNAAGDSKNLFDYASPLVGRNMFHYVRGHDGVERSIRKRKVIRGADDRSHRRFGRDREADVATNEGAWPELPDSHRTRPHLYQTSVYRQMLAQYM